MRQFALLLALAVPAAALADITFYTSQTDFETAAMNAGYVLFEVEDYEECTLPPNSVMALNAPLAPGVPNGPFPSGLTGVSDMRVQSNLLAGPAPQPSPRGVDGLAAISVGFYGASSDGVLSNYFVDSHDLIFDDGAEKVAVGFNPLTLLGSYRVDVAVYGPGEVLLGTTSTSADEPGSYFLGIVATAGQTIHRINIYDAGGGAEGADNIQTWIPEPASAILLLGAFALLRRR